MIIKILLKKFKVLILEIGGDTTKLNPARLDFSSEKIYIQVLKNKLIKLKRFYLLKLLRIF